MTPKPRSEAMLMIDPPVPFATMRRAAAWPTRNTPSRLTDITLRHSSSLVRVKKAPDGMPALLTRMVMGPSADSAWPTARSTEARSVTSMATAAASPPPWRISASSRRSTSIRRAASATLAPASASTRAKWRPNPEEAPVTSAVLPASEKMSRRAARLLFSGIDPRHLTHEVALSQLDAVVTQDGVGGSGVEEEIGHDELQQVGPALEGPRVAADLQRDLAVLRAVDLGGLEAPHIVDRPAHACLELGEGRLVVGPGGNLCAGKPRGGALGEVAGDVDLAREGEHVGRQPAAEQDALIDLAGCRVRLGLPQNTVQRTEDLHENRHRGIEHRERHGRSPWSWMRAGRVRFRHGAPRAAVAEAGSASRGGEPQQAAAATG